MKSEMFLLSLRCFSCLIFILFNYPFARCLLRNGEAKANGGNELKEITKRRKEGIKKVWKTQKEKGLQVELISKVVVIEVYQF